MTTDENALCVVVDTNVLAVAEGLQPDASPECVAVCQRVAARIAEGLPVVVDSAESGEHILREYLGTLRDAKTAGIAAKLVTHLWRRRWDPAVCRSIDITPTTNGTDSFEEVPEMLRDFDTDDHKWLAVAVAESSCPQILQALDKEWWERRRDFAAAGLDVQFLCATDLLQD